LWVEPVTKAILSLSSMAKTPTALKTVATAIGFAGQSPQAR
jgi:hypothetical protein